MATRKQKRNTKTAKQGDASKAETKAEASQQQKAEEKVAVRNFPMSDLRTAFMAMANEADAKDSADAERVNAGFTVLELAHDFAEGNVKAGITLETVVKGWGEHMAGLALELAIAGNRFAKLQPGTEGKPDTAILTGYGDNVKSIAKGVIEYSIDPKECLDGEGNATYREARKAVEARRLEDQHKRNPDLAKLREAKAMCNEAWKALKERVFETKDPEIIGQLTDLLLDTLQNIQAQQEEQDKTEAEAEGAKPEAEAEETREAA